MNRKTANFDYSVAMFSVAPKMGVSIGLVPFSNVGYNFTTADRIGNSTTTSNMSYYGEGGFSQAFIGIGAQVLKGLSIGGNFSYAWGRFEKTLVISSNDSYVNTITKSYSTNISSYKIDLGAQYEKALGQKDVLTFGAAIGIGHNLGADANMAIVNKDGQTSVLTTKDTTLVDAYSLPNTFRVGAVWVHNKSLTIGADYALEKWGSLEFPESNEYTDRFEMSKSALRDRHKVIVGVDWIPDPNPMARRSFFKRMHYKFGASYATPYYNIKGQDGPREYALTAGFSIPISNSWNNRSVLNISAQWVNTSARNFITENSFRINIGLTFNERWFAKWKVD